VVVSFVKIREGKRVYWLVYMSIRTYCQRLLTDLSTMQCTRS